MHTIKTDKRVTNIPESYLKEDEFKVALFRRQNQKGNPTIVNEQFNKEFLEYWKKISDLPVETWQRWFHTHKAGFQIDDSDWLRKKPMRIDIKTGISFQ